MTSRDLARAPRGLFVALAATLALAATPAAAHADPPLVLCADSDDDDTDGVPDREQANVPGSSALATVPRAAGAPGKLDAITGDAVVRVLVDGRPIAAGDAVPARAKRLEVQAIGAGRAQVALEGRTFEVRAVEVLAIDGAGKLVDLARSHASIQRTAPDRLADDPFGPSADPDVLRFVVAGRVDDLPATISVSSVDPGGATIDAVNDAPLVSVPCPAGVASGLACGSTLPIRAVSDDIDRNHPTTIGRSVKAELGGALVLAAGGAKLATLRVAGPRASALGPIGLHRARLRVLLVRVTPGGPAPLGGDAASAIDAARREVTRANAVWAACGVSFGAPADLDATVVDPPPPYLLALGCDQGLPASGGAVRVRVDGHAVTASITAGMRPDAAAHAVAAAIARAGFVTRVSLNPTIGPAAQGSADVLVHRKDGSLASITPPESGPVSLDATMTACIGRVDLTDGLQHFGDADAIAGTVEERALIKAFDDGDPATIDVLMVPSFGGGGRIGESFIQADAGAIRNTVIEDRAGIRADRASFALAHEIGHVLLDDPGHPDDFGVDTPTRLMDADAANPSAYGPRRLLVDECVRALRQSGPGGSAELLRPIALSPLGKAR